MNNFLSKYSAVYINNITWKGKVSKYGYYENKNKTALTDEQQRGFLVHIWAYFKVKTQISEMFPSHGGPYQSEEITYDKKC